MTVFEVLVVLAIGFGMYKLADSAALAILTAGLAAAFLLLGHATNGHA